MNPWATSLALHGAALGAVALLWLDPPAEKAEAALHWEVAMVAPAPEPAAPPEPPKPVPAKPEIPKPVQAAPAPKPRPVARVMPVSPEPAAIEAPAAPVASVAATPPVPVSAAPVEAAPTSAADEAARAAAVERRWYQVLMAKLRTMKRYPMPARRLGQEGVVLVEAHFSGDGRLLDLEVKRGSGFALLDNDACKLVENATEAARGELHPDRPARLEIPIAYRLES